MPRKQSLPAAAFSKHWSESGALPHTKQLDHLSPEDREQYRRWLLLERTLQSSSVPLEERAATPSNIELERGFQRVWERGQQQPSHSNVESAPSVSWRKRLFHFPLWVGATAALFVLVLWNHPSFVRDGFNRKGGKGKPWKRTGPQQINLTFGVSPKNSSQVTQRGFSGMKVNQGGWLYFQWTKAKASGHLYLFLSQNKRPLSQIYPIGQQKSFVKEGKRSWMMELGGKVLRYKVPKNLQTLAFVGILSEAPLTAQQRKQLTSRRPRLGGKEAMLLEVARSLKKPRQWVDGFIVLVKNNSVK